ncbi:hypothetical protein DSECCO2_571250 [anaerobic digester metagenome]
MTAHGFNSAPSLGKVSGDVTDVFVGRIDFYLHHRLKQQRVRFHKSLLEADGSAGLEGKVGRVNRVELSVEQHNFYIHNREAGKYTVGKGFQDAFVNRRDIFAGNGTALDFVDKFVTFAFVGLNTDLRLCKLAFTTGLFGVAVFDFHFLADGFAESHGRFSDHHIKTEFMLQPVNDDFEVKLAHP